MHDTRIDHFLTAVAESDGVPPLSGAKLDNLDTESCVLLIEDLDEVVAVGVVAHHTQPDASEHWALETALAPGLRFAEFEDRLLASTRELVPANVSLSVWSHRQSLDDALRRAGFVAVRELAYLVVDLMASQMEPVLETRPYTSADAPSVVAVNRAAFSSHREAAGLGEEEVDRLVSQPEFGPSGLRVAEVDGSIVGFCWTRTHTGGDGEIYRIAVSPEHQGKGMGRALLAAGFDYLRRQPGVLRGSLWVDMASTPAVSLYESVGMVTERVNREFEPSMLE